MIRGAALVDEVTLVNPSETPTGESRYGDPVFDDAPGEAVPAFVTPLDATEEEINREVRLNRYAVVLEVEAEVDGLSSIVWNGKTYRVVGEPRVYTSHRGPHHVELEMRRNEG